MKKPTNGYEKILISIHNENTRIIRKKRASGITTADIVNLALDNHFTFNLTLYIIVHKISKRFHIGYFENEDYHDLKWHHIYSTGSGTVGDYIRTEGFGRFKLEAVGKFSNLDHLIRTYRHYRKILSKRAEPYESHRADDDIEVLLKTYSKSIGSSHAKKEASKKIRE